MALDGVLPLGCTSDSTKSSSLSAGPPLPPDMDSAETEGDRWRGLLLPRRCRAEGAVESR